MLMVPMFAMATQQAIYEDRAQDVVVNSAQPSPSEVVFTSMLPQGWSFEIRLDGDQNGQWGISSGEPKSFGPTPDRSFGLHADGKTFCFQHILTSSPENPEQTFASTACGAFPSKAVVEFGEVDERARRSITIKIPADELFGTGQTARIGVCVWDTKARTCQYTLADPYILTRT